MNDTRTDRDETVITRCPTEGCDEIMGRNGDGDLVCTTCGHVAEIGTCNFELAITLQDSLEIMTPGELERAIHEEARAIFLYGLDVTRHANQIVACVEEQERRGE
ncbi:hypothetical protein LCGC14_2067530 [marine sediment metagenome]|uniref:TFIIB-type domain-containing protein n=1 Tax=marine sediment metagenome TaxID=412755 RepID=A0A0F9HGD3_9ZZZZ